MSAENGEEDFTYKAGDPFVPYEIRKSLKTLL